MSADAEVKVRITGDASDLEGAIQKVEKELGGLNAMSNKGLEALAKTTAENGGFAKMVEQSRQSLSKKKEALAQTEKEYKKNSTAIRGNIAQLEKQRDRLQNLAVSKQDEISVLKTSSAHLTKNSAAYKENQKAVQWTETELRAVKSQYEGVCKSIRDHENALKKEGEAVERSRREIADAQKQYDTFLGSQEKIEKTEKAIKLEKTGKDWKELGENVDAATKPLQIASAALAAGAVASATFAIGFEDNFANVEKTVDGTDEQLKRIKQDIIDMSTVGINGHSAIPQTTAELTELAAAGGQLGIQIENISGFTETMAMMGSATNLAGEEGAKTLARFMNVTATSQDKVQNLGSSIVDLGNHFATTEAEIANMAMNMGATGTSVGIGVQDILAYATALSSLGTEAEAGGSAVSRIWMDIQSAVSEGGEDLKAFAKTSGKTSADFAKEWKEDAGRAFLDFLTGLSQSEDIIGELQKLGFNNIRDLQALQKLAGPEGISLLNNALERSSRAWSENTALVDEFEKKAATTASQIEVTKNNLVEAGRSIGELLLPAVSSGAIKVTEFAQGIAKMDDAQKQTLITAGKWVIGLGAASKVTASTIKGVGGVVEAAGKLQKATTAGGVLAKFAPALTAAGAAAPYAAAGIAALTGGVWLGKKAYDAWYRSNYAWSEGLTEGNKAIEESLGQYKQLSDIREKIKTLKLVIENPESSREQVDVAKAKLEEIKALLEKEYDLKINSDNSNLESAVENAEKLSGNALRRAIADQEGALARLRESYKDSMEELPKLNERFSRADERLTQFTEWRSELSAIGAEYRNGLISQEEWNAAIEKTGKAMGLTSDQSKDCEYVFRRLGEGISNAQREIDDLNPKIEDLTKSQKDYVATSTNFTNNLTEYLREQLVSGDMDGAAKTIERIGKAAANAGLDLEGYGKTLTDIAKVSGMINENQTIKISADGAVSILEEVEDAANELNGKQVELTVNADGTEAYATIDGVQYKIASYDGETGEAILTADGQKADMVINFQTGKVRAFGEEEGKATLSAIDNVSEVAKKAAESLMGLKDKTITITTVVKGVYQGVKNLFASREAKGTRDFDGGMAMINDQRGISDPRELVEVDGEGYIFEGKDVVLPLPRHAKVYTADQTKQIMNRSGIARYAGGKNNDDWEAVKADWTHYTKTHDVTASEKLEHWENMLLRFKSNAEAVKEIQEEMFAETRAQWTEDLNTMRWYFEVGATSAEEYYRRLEQYRNEHFEGDSEQWRSATKELYQYGKEHADALNQLSEEYISYHNAINDWADIGDSPTAAFERVKARTQQDVGNRFKTEKEAADYLKEIGDTMLDDRIAQSNAWIAHQKEYCNMSVRDEVAALDRMLAYNEEYYREGIIGYEKYLTERRELRERRMNAYAEDIDNWRSDADFYQKQSEVFGWGFNGTGHQSKESYWQARLDRELANAGDRNLSDNQRKNAARYADEARMEVYKAREEALDQILQDYQKEIEEFQKLRDEEVQKLRDAWTVTDRKKEIEETERQLSLYRNAQTKEGQEKYKDLEETLERLRREEMVAQMEEETQAQLKAMNAEYEQMEMAKANELAGLKDDLLRYGGDQLEVLNATRAIADRAVDNAMEIAQSMSGIEQQIAGLSSVISAFQTPNVINNFDYSPNVYNNITDRFAADALTANMENGAMKFFGRVG